MTESTATTSVSLLDRPVEWRLMTPDEVLSVLKLLHQISVSYDEADAETPVEFDTTIAAWDDAGYNEWFTTQWRGVSQWANCFFEIDFTPGEWREAIVPVKKHTLRDFCKQIAKRARVPKVMPARILGRDCKEAGAFLTLRSLLQDAGTNTKELAPSTPLASLAKSHIPRIYVMLIRAWPSLGAVSKFSNNSDGGHLFAAGLLFFLMSIFAVLTLKDIRFVIPALIAIVSFIWIWKDSIRRQQWPKEVTFDEKIQTMGDLARWLVSDKQADPILEFLHSNRYTNGRSST